MASPTDGPVFLLLYAGPDTHDSQDIAIQLEAPWVSPYVVAVDTHRDSKRHDMRAGHLYVQFLTKAKLAIVGSPNCKTWSVLAHKPQKDGTPGHPLRGRQELDC